VRVFVKDSARLQSAVYAFERYMRKYAPSSSSQLGYPYSSAVVDKYTTESLGVPQKRQRLK